MSTANLDPLRDDEELRRIADIETPNPGDLLFDRERDEYERGYSTTQHMRAAARRSRKVTPYRRPR